MTGQRASHPVDPTDHPLRAALARGDRVHAASAPALHHLLTTDDRSLIAEAVVAQVRGLLSDLALQLTQAGSSAAFPNETYDAIHAGLLADGELRAHCHALALEWWLAQALERELALDPVLSPRLQAWVAEADAAIGSIAMAALAAQARFAQGQRRMELPLAELPAELFHGVLAVAREATTAGDSEAIARTEARLRADYDEAGSRLALFARLAREGVSDAARVIEIEEAGVALWLSAVAERSGEDRDRIAFATADPELGRLLLTLRAAGVAAAEAERQALRIQPEATVPRGLGDVGTREAAQWLAEVRV